MVNNTGYEIKTLLHSISWANVYVETFDHGSYDDLLYLYYIDDYLFDYCNIFDSKKKVA